ncbi:IclR family transcriptional regulator [Salinarimonas sp. NSM]|uniref:IclR family transcriptional regulator n=1 Tax=Salinarimonas sp. NSM TaxID=3458003 RepID=UPI0040359318
MPESATGTIERVIRMMRALAEEGGDVTIKSLAERLDLPGSTVHRLLALLMKEQIVERGEIPHSYRAGVEFYRISSLIVASRSVRDVARPFLERVARSTGEVCLLMRYMPAQHRVMLEDSVDSPHPLRYAIALYEPLSVLWGATGRSVLAFLPEDEVAAIHAAGEVSPATGREPPALDDLLGDLREIRRKGYALTFGQKIPGAVGFGVPVFERGHKVFGSLCVTIPQIRYDPSQEREIAGVLQRESAELSAALGNRGAEQREGNRRHG